MFEGSFQVIHSHYGGGGARLDSGRPRWRTGRALLFLIDPTEEMVGVLFAKNNILIVEPGGVPATYSFVDGFLRPVSCLAEILRNTATGVVHRSEQYLSLGVILRGSLFRPPHRGVLIRSDSPIV